MFTAFERDGEGIGEVRIDGGWIFLDNKKDGDVVDHYQIDCVSLLSVLLGLQTAFFPCLHLSQDIRISYAFLSEIVLLLLI